jgi:uncharacterized protein (TIGR02246 family)
MDRRADEAAIGELLMKLAKGFRDLDVRPLEDIYVEDADWTNAFGRTCHGREEILAYLRRLFAEPRFAAGEVVGEPQASIRFLDDGDVAVVKTYVERRGQETVEGKVLNRRNHSLKVLQKRDGRWLIVSEMYMDAREEHTFAA